GIPPLFTSTVVNGLTNGTAYTFQVVAVNLAGSSAPSAQSNVVTPTTPNPRLVSSVPADNATGVTVSADVTATFDRPVTLVNGTSVRLRNNATGGNVAAVVTYEPATNTARLNPNANLIPSTSYTLTLLGTGANGIRDAAGLRITTTTVDFTTAADATPPTVVSTTPADGATGVLPGANTVVTFSERVLGATAANVVLRDTVTNAVVPSAVTINAAGTVVTINPNANLVRNRLYRLTLTGGPTAVRDAFGNPLVTRTVSFTTRP
ncbi:MAG: Ig-like domain-containing protein, partial [Solirubrobacteraceae bacterium]|nr:Ig-like domain-containing protein [Solirubrobacteraceae bacterium]